MRVPDKPSVSKGSTLPSTLLPTQQTGLNKRRQLDCACAVFAIVMHSCMHACLNSMHGSCLSCTISGCLMVGCSPVTSHFTSACLMEASAISTPCHQCCHSTTAQRQQQQ